MIEFAALCGFRATELSDIETAAGEALANAAEHGDLKVAAGFAVAATCDESVLVIEIKDYGTGFDTGAVVDRRPDPFAGRGYGIFLMKTLMDEVDYSESGTRIRLVKRAT